MLHSFNDKSLPNGEYRYVCLAEQESVVYSLLSFEEKILDAVDRLIEISDFKGIEIERELQKEFKYYWNDACENKKESYDVYIAHSEKCACCILHISLKSIHSMKSEMNTQWN